jgi:predicted signal transduction protein with EAL and GGDEF domain
VADRIRQRLTRPFQLDDITLHVEASIGVALAPDHGGDVAALLRRADIAMYQAKEERAGTRVYDPDLDGHSPDRLRTVEELRSGITAGQLVLHHQPKAGMRDGRVHAVEALVRWQHPTRGCSTRTRPSRWSTAAG